MEKEFFDKIMFFDGDGCETTLTYYLLKGSISEEFCDLMVYGAQIDREKQFLNGKTERDKKIIHDLFFVKSEAEEFLKMIADKRITPTELKFAVHKYIGERLKNVESV